MIPDLVSNGKREPIITELLIGGREISNSVDFII